MKFKLKKTPGPLLIIAMLLVVSAGVRLPILATSALASDSAPGSETASEPDRSSMTSSRELDLLLKQLKAREEKIEMREAELSQRSEKKQ